MTLGGEERTVAAARTRAARWTGHGGDVIVLERRARARPAEVSVVRVLLAYGERLVRAGLRGLLEGATGIVVAGEAASGDEAVALAGEVNPDVVVVDVRLAGLDGFEATRQITAGREFSQVEVLMLGDGAREDLFGALHAGASGFLTMDSDPAELLRAVRVLAGGGMALSPGVTRRLIDEFASQPVPQRATPEPFEELTVREREVVALVASGLTNREIAERLVVSPATAKTHVSRAMIKLHVRDRAKLVALAYQTGFAQPPGERAPEDDARHLRGGATMLREMLARADRLPIRGAWRPSPQRPGPRTTVTAPPKDEVDDGDSS